MSRNRFDIIVRRSVVCLIVIFACTSLPRPSFAVQSEKRPFTVADDIAAVTFGGPDGDTNADDMTSFSPDDRYIVVSTTRGDVASDQVVATLHFYHTADIERAVNDAGSPIPKPFWEPSFHSEEGSVVGRIGWLPDSSGIAFVERMPGGRESVELTDIARRMTTALSRSDEDIDPNTAAAVHDARDYVYESRPTVYKRPPPKQAAFIGTGQDFGTLALGQTNLEFAQKLQIWSVIDGKRTRLNADLNEASISNDGRWIVTTEPVVAPASWVDTYRPPYKGDPDTIVAGSKLSEFARLDLVTGKVDPVLDTPMGLSAGWYADLSTPPALSPDNKEVALPGAFLVGNPQGRPCVAVVQLATHDASCLFTLKGHSSTGVIEAGYNYIGAMRFLDPAGSRLLVTLQPDDAYLDSTAVEYDRDAQGTWHEAKSYPGVLAGNIATDGLAVFVRQSVTSAPVLVARKGADSRIIWDPNPQFAQLSMAKISVMQWKDSRGVGWEGGLYEPHDIVQGKRYPLVIQTHGFDRSIFSIAGGYPTAFAAMEMAAQGIIVLQAGYTCPTDTVEEAPCAVDGYASAAEKLAREGLVDPKKVGIIGFSRTGLYVMKAITTSRFHFAAASANDSYMLDYFQYMLQPDIESGEADQMIGAPPFGSGLKLWLQRAPSFNLDKVTTPLLVGAPGPAGVLEMWMPYAGLHHLHKPVELFSLNVNNGPGTLPYEHVLTNPGLRMASQGINVDWFRFWLTGEEDPSPAKRAQYDRWEKMRAMQTAEHVTP